MLKSRRIFMKRIFVLLLFLCVCLGFTSCSSTPSAREAMADFVSVFGDDGVIYSPEIREGERGYIDGDFLGLMFGESCEISGDFAVWLSSSLSSVCEAGIFCCDTSYAARLAERTARERIALIEGIAASSQLAVAESVILRIGSTVVYYVGSDPELATRAWKSIL